MVLVGVVLVVWVKERRGELWFLSGGMCKRNVEESVVLVGEVLVVWVKEGRGELWFLLGRC